MQIVESIQKARSKGIADDLILQEIGKQNPEKQAFFKKAQERGANSSKILDEIIKQNSPSPEKKTFDTSPPSSPQTPPSQSPPPTPQPSQGTSSLPITGTKNETTDKTVLTKEAQEEEEKMRDNFLKRIEARERGESVEGDNPFGSPQGEDSSQSAQEMSAGMPSTNKQGFPKIIIIIAIGVLILLGFAFLAFSLF